MTTYTDSQELASVTRFVDAGVALGEAKIFAAQAEFDDTGHSCYSEGYAAGYAQAFRIVADFIASRES